ncbi:hypothetical protein BVC93_12950 [Mycobacterium sp. MS1601]|nr:hypothetical protein BVC93_12950 [Mycobacterium sp. MS1601]
MTIVSALVASVVPVACADPDTGSEIPTAQTMSATTSTVTPAANIEAHNNADIWFVRQMIPHQQQEVEISDILMGKPDVEPRVTDLAIRNKTARSSAIQQMRSWLDQWAISQTPADGSAPGRLTERELTALRQTRGTDAGRLFLSQLIVLHEGAISLAQNEIEEGQYPPAVAMARMITSTHQQDLDSMRDMLASL